uniref:Uncharacterized protein n=1 Tax=Tanacetum cinerariifolium TaxID=118510 RepID=A0A699TDE3_TANCI|nr:hypothetical protein [Tanacetum cinerariifolium]
MMDADHELAERLREKEQGELTIEERLKLFVELMNERKKNFARLRAKERGENHQPKLKRGIKYKTIEDLETLWKLVKAKYENTRLEKAYEKVLWGDLKVMFEPDIKSEV